MREKTGIGVRHANFAVPVLGNQSQRGAENDQHVGGDDDDANHAELIVAQPPESRAPRAGGVMPGFRGGAFHQGAHCRLAGVRFELI